MEMPPPDNPEPTRPNISRSPQKTTRKRSNILRYAIPAAVLVVLFTILTLAAAHVIKINFGITNIQDKPISDILNLADHHQLKSVSISGDDIYATGTAGQQYHAVKEDGQSVTEIFRHDGVTVSIDNGQRAQWGQVVIDIILVGLI